MCVVFLKNAVPGTAYASGGQAMHGKSLQPTPVATIRSDKPTFCRILESSQCLIQSSLSEVVFTVESGCGPKLVKAVPFLQHQKRS